MELEHRMTSDIDGFKKCSKCFRYVILHIIPIGHFRAPQLMNDDYRGVIQFTSVYTILYYPFYSWRMEMLKINMKTQQILGRHDPRGPPRPVARPLESTQPVPPGEGSQAPRTPGGARTPGRPRTPETPPPEPMEQPEFRDLTEI